MFAQVEPENVAIVKKHRRRQRRFLYDILNLVPRVFVPYCAGLTERATLESSVRLQDRF